MNLKNEKGVTQPEKDQTTQSTASQYGLEVFEISNRRYLGSKTKLLPQIQKTIEDTLGRMPSTLLDPFAGTGAVAAHFASLNTQVITSDLLLHNSLAHESFLLHSGFSLKDVAKHLQVMNQLDPISGYISEKFGDKYFSLENARRLDAAREYIEAGNFEPPLRAPLITSLLYAADKIAQTVGHYDAFFPRAATNKEISLRLPNPIGSGSGHLVMTEDANRVVSQHKAEVLYLDPPYNSRQYSDAYHVLENIARWDKPQVFGVAQKMDRTHLKSKYSTRAAESAFEELILSAKADLIVLSYSNTGETRAARSNNALGDEFILRVFESVGRVRVQDIEFKEFSVGRTSKRDHYERLFVCEVGAK